MKLRPLLLASSILLSFGPLSAAEGVILTELMANNVNALRDEERDSPDWVELFNLGDSEVSLDGYYLTDDIQEPRQWKFPAVSLEPGRFLLVFCSGKNLVDPTLALHTNFKLAESGDSIYLVAQDGTTIVSSLENYPPQQPDVSYGVGTGSASFEVLKVGAPASVSVPSSGDLGLGWTLLDFDASSWRKGTTAIGYGVSSNELELVKTDVAAEMRNVNSSIFVRVPFDVADPAKIDVLKLRVRYNDGFVAYVNGQVVGSANAPQTIDWRSSATGAHGAQEFEEFDISNVLGGLKVGENILAIQGLNVSTDDSDFFLLPEMEAVDLDEFRPEVRWYFPVSTPGRQNGKGFPEAAPKPTFSLPSGMYVDSRQVELFTDLPGGVIRYTVDGSTPRETSLLYSAPIAVKGAVRITARVFKEGMAPGPTERNTFVIADPKVAAFTSNLPLVVVLALGNGIGACGADYSRGHVLIITPGKDGNAVMIDEPELSSAMQFRQRGRSTCGLPKFGFNLEINDAQGEDKQVNIFGFPRESDFVMFGGDIFDRINMRNPVAYFMSRECGRYAARTKYVECFFNPGKGPLTETHYFGTYAFMERMKQSPERINITSLLPRDRSEPEVTGGYILKRDNVDGDEVTIAGGGYPDLVLAHPSGTVPAQRAYIRRFLDQMVASLNPQIGRQEDNDYIDFTAWIDHHILCWYTKNVDAFRLSAYFYKDRNGPLVMGPVWDFDRAMGGFADDDRSSDPLGYHNANNSGTQYFASGESGSWYSLLFNNSPPLSNTPWNLAYKGRWRELRKGPLATANILAQIDAWAIELSSGGAADRNVKRWPELEGHVGGFQGEVDHLKNWLATRADWIDSEFAGSPEFDPPAGFVNPGSQVKLSVNRPATIYYTLDGSDPRALGGDPAPTASIYSDPVTIQGQTRIVARARLVEDGIWSSPVEAKYYTKIPTITITEVMYFPAPPTPEEDPGKKFNTTRMEFVELMNIGSEPLSLAGITFTKGIAFTFDGVAVPSLKPGERVLVTRDRIAFAARYGSEGFLVAGDFEGALSDVGEFLALRGDFEQKIFDFKYDGNWYPEAKGIGHSIVNKDPLGDASTLGEAARWGLSSAVGGSPGKADSLSKLGAVPGDSNRDGKINVTDAIRMLQMLFGGFLDGPCSAKGLEDAANQRVLDWDGNASVNVADVLLGLTYLFQRGLPHAAGIGCVEFQGCDSVCAE